MVKEMIKQWHCDGLRKTKTEDKLLATHKKKKKKARQRRM
jgi:hypothetical protein